MQKGRDSQPQSEPMTAERASRSVDVEPATTRAQRLQLPRQRTPIPQLPVQVRKEIAAFARKLKRDHPALFASDPLYRKRAGQFLTALLPPKPRRRGRPGRADVTQAFRLLRRFKRQYPGEKAAKRWARMYPAVIAGYGAMNPVEQRDARERLRERVRWRRRTTKRSAPHGKIPPTVLRL